METGFFSRSREPVWCPATEYCPDGAAGGHEFTGLKPVSFFEGGGAMWGVVLWSMICDSHILDARFAFKTSLRLRKWQRCIRFIYDRCVNTLNMFDVQSNRVYLQFAVYFRAGSTRYWTSAAYLWPENSVWIGSSLKRCGFPFAVPVTAIIQSHSWLMAPRIHQGRRVYWSFIRGSECFRLGFSVAADNLLPCTIVVNSLGLNFQDDIFENAACGTVDGSMTIRTLGDVAVRLKWNGAIKSFLVRWAPISVAQIMRSISVLGINPRWAHFEPQHYQISPSNTGVVNHSWKWINLRFLYLLFRSVRLLFAHVFSTSWMYRDDKTHTWRHRRRDLGASSASLLRLLAQSCVDRLARCVARWRMEVALINLALICDS